MNIREGQEKIFSLVSYFFLTFFFQLEWPKTAILGGQKKDFNEKSFINAHSFRSDKELINYILEVDNNQNLYQEMLSEPWFKNNKVPEFVKPENVLNFVKDKL